MGDTRDRIPKPAPSGAAASTELLPQLPLGGPPGLWPQSLWQLVARTWRCSSVRVRGQLPSNRMTKQSQFLIKPCFTYTYGKFGGLIESFDLSG